MGRLSCGAGAAVYAQQVRQAGYYMDDRRYRDREVPKCYKTSLGACCADTSVHQVGGRLLPMREKQKKTSHAAGPHKSKANLDSHTSGTGTRITHSLWYHAEHGKKALGAGQEHVVSCQQRRAARGLVEHRPQTTPSPRKAPRTL